MEKQKAIMAYQSIGHPAPGHPSNTPIDEQTCQKLGLPMGSMWGENATKEAFEAYQSIGYPVISAKPGYPMSMPAQSLSL